MNPKVGPYITFQYLVVLKGIPTLYSNNCCRIKHKDFDYNPPTCSSQQFSMLKISFGQLANITIKSLEHMHFVMINFHLNSLDTDDFMGNM